VAITSDGALPFAVESTHVSGRRYIAHLADGVVYTLLWIVVMIPAAIVSDILLIVVLVVGLTVGHVAYFVFTQRSAGRSPGKWLARIKVVDAEGGVPTTGALVRRSIPLLVEYLYVVAFISMLSSSTRQRLGDRWAHTYVIHDDARGAGAG
jgi:uncharacterized RDD family membrane protein YckC